MNAEQATETGGAPPPADAPTGTPARPTVRIGGADVEIVPLGVRAMAPLARIADVAGHRTDIDVMQLFQLDRSGRPLTDRAGRPIAREEAMGRFLIAAVGFAEEDVLELLSQMLGDVPVEELKDPYRFPLMELLGLLNAALRGIDAAAFLPGGRRDAESEATPEA